MPLPVPKTLLLLAVLMAPPFATAAQAQEEAAALAGGLAPRVLFVTSGGYWEEAGDAAAPAPDAAGEKTAGSDAAAPAAEAAGEETAGEPTAGPAPGSRGYYRLIAIRGADNRSQLHLQQIALTPEGPELALSIGIDEINALGAYVTDIRPEDSTGAASAPGFAAYIYLKTDPKVAEPETWALYVDEFGEIQVERSSN
ncbi:hypothetical protein LL06_21950 [Hoeflea sp. BAL378]|uniref:hypothetical protein n=1 Tax=Hoeflea sp. BAL378 TaxID=1547437 RepID=UPI0005143BCC|nr:hypothetical protein [Hoeflea sp. BAL378]KGF67511.1 hypothetical protein LL06_21950 [Hoeflea sp. BAL378]